MPFKIIAPLFAFFFGLLLIARREFQYVPLTSFLVSVLIHGYLSMVILALPAFFVTLIIGLRQHESRITKAETRYLVSGLLIAAVFVLPIIIDTLFSDASNVGKILEYSHKKIRSPKLAEILASFGEHALHGLGIIQLSLLLAGTYLFGINQELGKIWKSSLLMALLLTVIFVVYHKFVPRPMFNNMVLFMQAVPIALVTLCVAGFFRFMEIVDWRRNFYRPALIAGLVLVTYAASMSLRPAYPNTDLGLRSLANVVGFGTLKSGYARIDYTEHDQWPVIAGLLFELKQRNYRACTTWKIMAFLYTPEQICSGDAPANITLVPESQCNGRCAVTAYGTGVVIPPPAG